MTRLEEIAIKVFAVLIVLGLANWLYQTGGAS